MVFCWTKRRVTRRCSDGEFRKRLRRDSSRSKKGSTRRWRRASPATGETAPYSLVSATAAAPWRSTRHSMHGRGPGGARGKSRWSAPCAPAVPPEGTAAPWRSRCARNAGGRSKTWKHLPLKSFRERSASRRTLKTKTSGREMAPKHGKRKAALPRNSRDSFRITRKLLTETLLRAEEPDSSGESTS